MKIIFIHGRGQQGQDPNQLRKEWEDALYLGFSRAGVTCQSALRISFPFYGDALDELISKLEAPLLLDVITRGNSISSGETKLQVQLMYEMALAYGLNDRDIQAEVSGPVERGIQNTNWAHAIARALDKTPLRAFTIDRITHDVAVYLTNYGVRRRIDQIVSEHLLEEPSIVIAHSLGSVVGFNVLRSHSVRSGVRLYVTLGSPLGLEAIKENLATPLVMPACISSWFNARDPRDIVAAFPLDSEHFPIEPTIQNKSDVDNFTHNRHGIAGYLSDPAVAQQIHAALTS